MWLTASPGGPICISRPEALAQERHDVVRLRVAADHRLREDELTVDVHVEDAALPRHDLQQTDPALPLLE